MKLFLVNEIAVDGLCSIDLDDVASVALKVKMGHRPNKAHLNHS